MSIVVIEGGDANGKQTQSKLLAERLKGKRFSFPNYESTTGKAILDHLKKRWSAATTSGARQTMESDPNKLDAMVFQCLQTVNRLELLPQILEASRSSSRGIVFTDQFVVLDRYWQSAVVYGKLDGLDEAWLRRVQQEPMPQARVNILLDCPIEEGFRRRPERRDRYEIDLEFLERVRSGYHELWELKEADVQRLYSGDPILMCGAKKFDGEYPSWYECNYAVNGTGSIEEVHERIWDIVQRNLNL